MSEEVITNSAEETIAWGRQFAAKLSAPILVLLSGDLGSGKTTLTKGIVSALGVAREDDVTSPTFTLVHSMGRTARCITVTSTESRIFMISRRWGWKTCSQSPES